MLFRRLVSVIALAMAVITPALAADDARLERLHRVSERLFAAAAPLCRGPRADCRPAVSLEEGRSLNAHAESGRITVTRTLVDLAASDDELALVLGHELAHLLLGHTSSGQLAAVSLEDGVRRGAEGEADHVGLYLVARSGFAPRDAALLWQRLGMVQPDLMRGGGAHSGLAARLSALVATCREIEVKQNRGLPLLPGA